MNTLTYEEWLEKRDAELLRKRQSEQPDGQYDFSGWALGGLDTPEEQDALNAAIEKMNREEYRVYVERMEIV